MGKHKGNQPRPVPISTPAPSQPIQASVATPAPTPPVPVATPTPPTPVVPALTDQDLLEKMVASLETDELRAKARVMLE